MWFELAMKPGSHRDGVGTYRNLMFCPASSFCGTCLSVSNTKWPFPLFLSVNTLLRTGLYTAFQLKTSNFWLCSTRSPRLHTKLTSGATGPQAHPCTSAVLCWYVCVIVHPVAPHLSSPLGNTPNAAAHQTEAIGSKAGSPARS